MSTYTPSLGLELITPGSQAGLWGNTTNNTFNLIDQAITGVTPVSFASASGSTYVLTDYNGAEDESRAAVLNVTGSATGANTIVIPNKQKTYLVRNNTGQDVTFQTATPTATYVVGAGYSILIFCDGNNNVFTGIASPGVGTLSVNAGGTGATTFTAGFVKSTGGTNALTSSSTVSLSSEVTGTLPVANGGTGVTSFTSGSVLLGNGTGNLATVTGSISGQVLTWNGSNWAPATPSSGGVTSISGLSPIVVTGTTTPVISINQATSGSSGYLSSTDWTTFNSKGSVTSIAMSTGSTGLTVSGSTSQTISTSGTFSLGGTLAVANGGTGTTTSTGSGSVVLNTSPTFATQITSPVFSFSSDGTRWNYSGGGIIGDIAGTARIQILAGGSYNSTGVWGTISDANLKENIQPSRNYLSDLNKVNVVKYSLKEDGLTEPNMLGVIAQELEQTFPNMVDTRDGVKSVKISVFIPMLIKAVQELSAEVEALKAAK